MAGNVLVDHPPGAARAAGLAGLLRRGALLPVFELGDELGRVLDLLHKYADIPMSLADACLVRL